MASQDITRIRVGRHPTGIVGLREALERVACEHKALTDDEVREKLMTQLSKRNYIHPKTQHLYEDAFLRAYKKYVGEPIGEDTSGSLQIRVLGPGCPNCEKMAQDLMQVITELRIAADLDHVRDPLEIGSYGMVSLPALVINGTIMSSGRVPGKEQVKQWLLKAAETN